MALKIILGGDIDEPNRVDAVTVLDVTAPPSDPIDGYMGQAGFWVELQDGNGAVIYRRILNDTLRSVEGPRDDQERRIVSVDPPKRGVRIRVLVPQLPNARRVVLMRSPADNTRAVVIAQGNLPTPI